MFSVSNKPCMLSVANNPFLLSVIVLSIYAECHYGECRGAKLSNPAG
jgi:hypothetical protein